MTTINSLDVLAGSLSEAERRAFSTVSSTDWHRRPRGAETAGGRVRDFDRINKCKRLGLIEHRVNMGAEYRLTDLGIALRSHLEKQ